MKTEWEKNGSKPKQQKMRGINWMLACYIRMHKMHVRQDNRYFKKDDNDNDNDSDQI